MYLQPRPSTYEGQLMSILLFSVSSTKYSLSLTGQFHLVKNRSGELVSGALSPHIACSNLSVYKLVV